MKKINIVLGGGGAKSFSELGIMKVLYENGIEVDRFVTSSMGSLFGIMLAHRIPIDEIKDAFYSRCSLFYWTSPRIRSNSLVSQDPVRKLLTELLPSPNLEDTKIPISIVTTDINTLEDVTLEDGNAIDAVCASCSHPLFNPPIEIKDRLLADGGITNNVPADICRQKAGEAGIVVTTHCCCPFDATRKKLGRTETMIRVVYYALEKDRIKKAHDYSDLVIDPFMNTFFTFKTWMGIFRFYKYNELKSHYERGKKATEEKLPEIMRLITCT